MDAEAFSGAEAEHMIEYSRVHLSTWTFAVHQADEEKALIATVCDTEIGLLDRLRSLSPIQQVSVVMLMHRWKDLRAACR